MPDDHRAYDPLIGISVQLAETRGELRELIVGALARVDAHDNRLSAVETTQGTQQSAIADLQHRRAADDARVRAWAAAGTLVGAVLGTGTTLAAALIA